jgi:hypothetical protein
MQRVPRADIRIPVLTGFLPPRARQREPIGIASIVKHYEGTMNKYAVAALTAFCCAVPTAQADEILDFTPLVRDFVDTNTGLEIAVPYIRYNDTTVPADGIPDSITLWFNIYPVGSTAKLHTSFARTIPVPALPCTQPDPNSVYDDMKVKFLGTTSVSRVHLVLTGSIECWDMADDKYKEAYKTVLYSSNAATAGNSWMKVWNFDTIAANGMNVDADADNEIMLTMEVPTPTGGANAKVVYLNGGDGTIVYDNSYPLSNGY